MCCLSAFMLFACGDPTDLTEELPAKDAVTVVLTEETHPEGWGLSHCLLCHQVFKIHRATSNPDVDLEKVREVVDRLGPESCMFCHGANGT